MNEGKFTKFKKNVYRKSRHDNDCIFIFYIFNSGLFQYAVTMLEIEYEQYKCRL